MGRVYRFLNTQLDHVDEGTSLVTCKDERLAIEVSREEILRLQRGLLTSDQHCECIDKKYYAMLVRGRASCGSGETVPWPMAR